jgi:hypothetical protein
MIFASYKKELLSISPTEEVINVRNKTIIEVSKFVAYDIISTTFPVHSPK